MSVRNMRPVLLVAAALLLLAACAAGPNDLINTAAATATEPAGFWLGLWHGVIAPITFIISLFNEGVGIYEVHNNGGWYDFGYMIGLSVLLGSGGRGSHAASRSRSRR
ncbi:hypothetical protein [Cellulomonas sp. KRMCY2]|uniref:hypothetical protein n=1 Tax=Cellulomonas sp. KRMCY2 TaxID=1304865 RepID=UPI00045E7F97|nr:hypothetical protein [Cellulomonas sp. KRMCY2]